MLSFLKSTARPGRVAAAFSSSLEGKWISESAAKPAWFIQSKPKEQNKTQQDEQKSILSKSQGNYISKEN